MRGRRLRGASSLLATVAALAVTACSGQAASRSVDASSQGLRIASYDFSESVLLAQLYAVALRANGFRTRVVAELGSREVVDPALMQGAVDIVPEYIGSALTFVTGGSSRSTTPAQVAYSRLRAAFAARGVVTLDYAQAQDGNGFVVKREAATRHGWSRMSDLVSAAPSLVFGGPPECVERQLCLRGLRTTYGLRFREFRIFNDQSVTAQALLTGEIDVGLLNTTNAALTDDRLLLLDDDRHLQPADNVVPVVNRAALRRAGPRLGAVLDAVSAHLDTSDLVAMNHAVDVSRRDPRAVATGWLREQGLLTGLN